MIERIGRILAEVSCVEDFFYLGIIAPVTSSYIFFTLPFI